MGKTALVRMLFTTHKGAEPTTVELTLHRDWSPIGYDRFIQMVNDGFYNNSKVHRVVPGFIIQFGIAAEPAHQAKWQHTIKDDAVTQSNARGFISFARRGDDTRSTQVFINLGNNADLDSQGFSPFGFVSKGMEAIDKSYDGYARGPEKPDAQRYKQEGDAYLQKYFPNLATFVKTEVVSEKDA